LRIKTDLTKILNPVTKPKPKTQHSFRLHGDLLHQSFSSSTKGIWDAIEDGPFIPQVKKDYVFVDKPWSEWTESNSKKAKFDWIVMNIITFALSSDEFFKVSQCKSA